MNSMMHNVSEFKGFTLANPVPARCQFLRNILQSAEMIGATENATVFRAPRFFLAVDHSSHLGVSSAQPLNCREDNGNSCADDPGGITDGDALFRFEWEGGLLGASLRP
jgi:hypothetical protein